MGEAGLVPRIEEMKGSTSLPLPWWRPIFVMVSRTAQPPTRSARLAKAVLIDWLMAVCSGMLPPVW